MNKITVRDLAEISIVAAIYVVLTIALTPLSYGDVQFRLSEALMLLIIYKRKYAISLIVGCLVANLFSPVGWVDIVFGTLATVIASIPMLFVKRMEISSLFPSIANGIIVGLELAIVYDLPIALTMAQVFIGEFVVCTLVAIPLFKALEKNEGFMKAIGCEVVNEEKKWLNPFISLSLAINIVSIICFFKLSLSEIVLGEDDIIYDTLFNQAHEEGVYLGIILILIGVLSVFATSLLKGRMGLIAEIVLPLAFGAMFAYIVASYGNHVSYTFYLYLIVPVLLLTIGIIRFIKGLNKQSDDTLELE